MSQTIFLLSPANLSGLRARQLTSPRSSFETAQMYQSPEGVPIALAFAFMSALYFRGKIAYALHFAQEYFPSLGRPQAHSPFARRAAKCAASAASIFSIRACIFALRVTGGQS